MQAVLAACDRVAQQIEGEGKYAHTSHLAVQIAGSLIYDRHFTGPELGDVYSVTKTVWRRSWAWPSGSIGCHRSTIR